MSINEMDPRGILKTALLVLIFDNGPSSAGISAQFVTGYTI